MYRMLIKLIGAAVIPPVHTGLEVIPSKRHYDVKDA